jgi:hypothetical protein
MTTTTSLRALSLKAPILKLATAMVGSIGELDATPPRDPTSGLIGHGFDLATQLPPFNRTAPGVSNADGNSGNDSVTDDKCPLPTKRQRSTLSSGDHILDNDGPNEREDSVFDVIDTDDDKDGADTRSAKQRKLPAVSCRYPGPASTAPNMQEDNTDQTQSPTATAAAIQQPDLSSGYDCHREGIAESASDNSGSLINGEPAGGAGNVTVAHQSTNQSTDVRDPQANDSWEIRNIIGTRTIDGVVQYWVDWDPT